MDLYGDLRRVWDLGKTSKGDGNPGVRMGKSFWVGEDSDRPICPRDPHHAVNRRGKSRHGKGLWVCRECGKVVNPFAVDQLVGRTATEVVRSLILATLRHCEGRKGRAARMLGLTPRGMYGILRRWREDGFGRRVRT